MSLSSDQYLEQGSATDAAEALPLLFWLLLGGLALLSIVGAGLTYVSLVAPASGQSAELSLLFLCH